MKPSTARPALLVPVHNAISHAVRCVTSLHESTRGEGLRIYVVDDGSTEDSSRLSELAHELGISFERRDQAKGFTKTVNDFLRTADSEEIFIANSDTIVSRGWLAKMLFWLRLRPDIGLVSPLSNAAGYQSIPRNYPTLIEKIQRQTPINTLPNGLPISEVNEILETSTKSILRVPSVHGFFLGLKKKLVQDIGLLDDLYFPLGYGEEIDYAIRATNHGWSSCIAYDTYVWHVKSASFGTQQKADLSLAGKEALIRKHGHLRMRHINLSLQGLHESYLQRLSLEAVRRLGI